MLSEIETMWTRAINQHSCSSLGQTWIGVVVTTTFKLFYGAETRRQSRKRTVVAGRSGCLGGCTILPYCSRTFWVYIAPFAFLSKLVVCSLALLIAVFLTSGEGTCASNPSKRFKESVKKKPAVWNVGFSCFGGLGNLDS